MRNSEHSHGVMLILLCAVVLTSFVLTTKPASAEDAFPPSWRGLSGTTFQEWTFNNGNDLGFAGTADSAHNPFGIPTASIEPAPVFPNPDSNRRCVLLDYGQYMFPTIPNRSGSQPGDYTLVSVQLTYAHYDAEAYYESLGKPGLYTEYPSTMHGAPADDPLGILVDERDVLLGTEGAFTWRVWQSTWRVQPSDSMAFRIGRPFADAPYSVLLDDVIIDTRSVPEPSALLGLLTGVGYLSVILRRRPS